MTPEMVALARRAVAAPGWRWMHGMVAVRVEEPPFFSEGADPSRLVGREYLVTEVTPDMVRCLGDSFRVGSTAYVPDLADPATVGCLLALVREVHVGAHVEPNGTPYWDGVDESERDHWWAVYACRPHRRVATGPTEAAALVAALEATPRRSE